MSVKSNVALGLSALALVLAACDKKAPAGQVVATVNGVEVTMQELNAELASANIPEGADKKVAQRAILQRVIERKLIAQEAAKRDLDKTAEYMGQKLRMDETLLAQQYVKQQMSTLPQPTAADLTSFMSSNPNAFAQRAQLIVDQIRFPTPPNPAVLKGLETVHTQDGVAAALTKLGIKFERGRTAIDSAQLPPDVVAKIGQLPAGEPFVLPAQGVVTINVLAGRQAITVPDAAARQIAASGWREKQFADLVKGKVDELRKAAKITYQPGFEPPVQGAAAGAAAKPAAPAETSSPAVGN